MVSFHPAKPSRPVTQWLLVMVLLICAMQPASAAQPPVVSSAASGATTDAWKGMFVSSVAPRFNHTAVWTGTEMIIWGGVGSSSPLNTSGLLNTGGRYNPTTGVWKAISTVNAPSARLNHTAVWTGSEMIVWGGAGAGGNLNTGGRYDPVTDTWTTLSTVNAPDARSDHTAVWTGTEMLVWGGENGSYLNTGGRYDPATNTWTTISSKNAPTARANHTAVWASDATRPVMIVWGGKGDGDVNNTGGRYDPAADSWTPTDTIGAPAARSRHTAVWASGIPTPVMIVWGGYGTGSNNINTGGRYNPDANTWEPTNTLQAPAARLRQTAVWTSGATRPVMIVWGGETDPGYSLDTGGCYDPVADAWTPTNPIGAPTSRHMHTAIWTGGTAGKAEMIIWGGSDDVTYLGEGGRFDPDKNTWAFGDGVSAPSGRYDHTAVWTGGVADGEMIIWGGQYIAYPYHFNTGGRYNPRKDTWIATSTTGAPEGRYGHTAVWTGGNAAQGSAANGVMIIWGGMGASGALNTGGCYHPTTDTWTAVSMEGAPDARTGHTAVWTGTKMIIWGGRAGSGAYLNTGGIYDPASNTWEPISLVDAPSARSEHTAIWTGTKMIIWGGKDGSTYFDTGGVYDPSTTPGTWAAVTMTDAPTARSNHTAVWAGDAAGVGKMIVWGGYNGTYLNTGGRYDPSGNTWESITTENAPDARYDHSAVWTGGTAPTGEMIIWGGYGIRRNIFYPQEYGYLNTGARYNPTTGLWTPIRLTGAPPERCYHTAVWSGAEMIVWGGYNNSVFNTGGRYMLIHPTFMPIISLNQ